MEKKKTKKKSIVVKILEILVIVIAIIGVLFIVNFVRNYTIMKDIMEKQKSIKNSTNYTYTTVMYNTVNDDKVIINHYYKDGKSKMRYNNGESDVTVWFDERTKENIFLDEKDKQANITSSEFMLGNELPYFRDEANIIYYSMTFFIINSNLNGKECYEIHDSNSISYVDKESGVLLKEVQKNVKIDDKKCESITEYDNWSFEELSEEEMDKPDLSGYTIVNN